MFFSKSKYLRKQSPLPSKNPDLLPFSSDDEPNSSNIYGSYSQSHSLHDDLEIFEDREEDDNNDEYVDISRKSWSNNDAVSSYSASQNLSVLKGDFDRFNENESKYAAYKREQAFIKSWNDVNAAFESIVHQEHTEFAKIISDYVKECYSSDSLQLDLIPVGWIIAGLNNADHPIYTSIIVEQLRDYITNKVSLISGITCRSIGDIIKSIIYQVVHINRKKYRTFDDLYRYFQELGGQDKFKLIILIEDFENFDNQLLSDFLYILKMHNKKLRVVIIGMLGTTTDIILHKLPRSISNFLDSKVFIVKPPSNIIDKFVENILTSELMPFQLTAEVYKFIYESFEYYTYSVTSFVSKLKFMFMEHFEGNPLSWICIPSFLEVHGVNDNDMAMFYWIIADYNERFSNLKANLNIKDDNTKYISKWTEEYYKSISVFCKLFKLYISTLRILKNDIIVRYEYLRVLENENIQYINDLIEELQSQTDFESILQQWINILNNDKYLMKEYEKAKQLYEIIQKGQTSTKDWIKSCKNFIKKVMSKLKPLENLNPFYSLFVFDRINEITNVFNPNIYLDTKLTLERLLKETPQ